MTPEQYAKVISAMQADREALHTRAINRLQEWSDPALHNSALQAVLGEGYSEERAVDILRINALHFMGSPHYDVNAVRYLGDPAVSAYLTDLAAKLHESHGKGQTE